jgi:L-cysteate sulfo-lyase
MARGIIDAGSLKAKIGEIPRVELGVRPTPLQECLRFSQALGGTRIFVKRDDLTGLAFGGNKVRKLEFLMAGLVQEGVEVMVTGAAEQSNFCRQASAAAAKLGIEAVLILMGDPNAEKQGNLLVDHLLGADVRLQELPDWTRLHETIYGLADDLAKNGRKARALTGFEPVGSIAYVECLVEIFHQCEALGISPDYLFVSSGTGTQAGLEVGARALGLDWEIIGVSPVRNLEGYESVSARLTEVANWVSGRLGLDVSFTAGEITNTPAYVGDGYAQLTDDGKEAIRLMAGTEGILLDPVYTGKAMAGLIDKIRQAEIREDSTVIFVHTGGTPALFAFNNELVEDPGLVRARP